MCLACSAYGECWTVRECHATFLFNGLSLVCVLDEFDTKERGHTCVDYLNIQCIRSE